MEITNEQFVKEFQLFWQEGSEVAGEALEKLLCGHLGAERANILIDKMEEKIEKKSEKK